MKRSMRVPIQKMVYGGNFKKNPQWLLYGTTIAEILIPLVLQQGGARRYEVGFLAMAGILLFEYLSLYPYGENIEGHSDCFTPGRKKFYSEILQQDKDERIWAFGKHFMMNVGLVGFLKLWGSVHADRAVAPLLLRNRMLAIAVQRGVQRYEDLQGRYNTLTRLSLLLSQALENYIGEEGVHRVIEG